MVYEAWRMRTIMENLIEIGLREYEKDLKKKKKK